MSASPNSSFDNSLDKYAVFGNPIKHSKSPVLQMAFAEQTGENIYYSAECVDVDKFSEAVFEFFNQGGKGLNITVPFKLDAFEYANELTPRATLAGAVNTLIKQGEKIIGDNTDGIGLVNDITNNLQWVLDNKKILVLGAGGAVRGVLGPLLEAKPDSITIANRTVEKAQALAESFSDYGKIQACAYEELSTLGNFDIIINGTSASLHGSLPNLPSSIIGSDSYCYDMMYGKENTVFMGWCLEQKAAGVADGLGMLICQGAESFFQWRGVYPQTQVVIEKIRSSL